MSYLHYHDTPLLTCISQLTIYESNHTPRLPDTYHAGEHILIGCGEQINLSHMLMINETAVFLIRKLQEGIATTEALAQCLTEEYNVTYPEALADTEALIRQLAEQGVVVISE